MRSALTSIDLAREVIAAVERGEIESPQTIRWAEFQIFEFKRIARLGLYASRRSE
ncbi:MAG: hypothetical protein ABI824_15940 [Acidobacteriota bacterium]